METGSGRQARAVPIGAARERVREFFDRIRAAVPPAGSGEHEPGSDSAVRSGAMSEAVDLQARLRSLVSDLALAAEGPLDAEDHFSTGEEDPLARPAYALAAVVEFLEVMLPDDAERHLGPLVQLIRWLAELGDGYPVAALSSRHRREVQHG